MASSNELKPYDPARFDLGELVVLEGHQIHKIVLSDEERSHGVRVYWDMNKAVIDRPDYPISELRDNITKALRHVNPDFRIVSFLGVGDTVPLRNNGQYAKLRDIEIIHSPERDDLHQCRFCKNNPRLCLPPPQPGAKIDAPNCSLIKAMIGDAVDRDCEGIILLITGDSDYSATLDFLIWKGMKVLLAQNRYSSALFRKYADVTWFMENLIEGGEPSYYYDE